MVTREAEKILQERFGKDSIIELAEGVLFSHGTRYDIDFTK